MSFEEISRRREELNKESDMLLHNMEQTTDECQRVVYVARYAERYNIDIDREFDPLTGLHCTEVDFLFAATGLQLARIAIINELTEMEAAGQSNKKEKILKKKQKEIFKKFNNGGSVTDGPLYASMNHIITDEKVPYDINQYAFRFNSLGLFEGGNHRYVTLGHDPILGLIFGTGNIMTNTLTHVKKGAAIPIVTTYHVIYGEGYKNARIGGPCPTALMLKAMIDRTQEQPSALVASLIKQIIHIGTDLYTPVGIPIPGASLVLSTSQVKKLTEYVSTGDLIKVGSSAKLAELINTLIATLHMLMYDKDSGVDMDVYNVRTRKIIDYSNIIASGSNALWVAGNMWAGNEMSIRQLDIGGLLIMLSHLMTDVEYIQQIKEEYVLGGFKRMILGDNLQLEKVLWD